MAHRARLIRGMEEISLTAWPSLQTVCYDGWLLRFAGGYTRRANSVSPIYDSTRPLDEKITHCERLYYGRSLPTIFKMTEAACPADLDAVLEARDYQADAHTSVQTVELAQVDFAHAGKLTFSTQPTDDWLEAFCRLNTTDPARIPLMRHMLANIIPAVTYAALVREGEIAAVGLAVADGTYVSLFDLVVDARWRGQGLGQALVLGLLQWGQAHGAQAGYLQVMLNNAPALRLYEKIGFREVYHYWYRVKQAPA